MLPKRKPPTGNEHSRGRRCPQTSGGGRSAGWYSLHTGGTYALPDRCSSGWLCRTFATSGTGGLQECGVFSLPVLRLSARDGSIPRLRDEGRYAGKGACDPTGPSGRSRRSGKSPSLLLPIAPRDGWVLQGARSLQVGSRRAVDIGAQPMPGYDPTCRCFHSKNPPRWNPSPLRDGLFLQLQCFRKSDNTPSNFEGVL